MSILLIGLLLLAVVGQCISLKKYDDPELYKYYFQQAINHGRWEDFELLLTKEIRVGGPDSPFITTRDDLLSANQALHASGIKLAYRQTEWEPVSEDRGVYSGFYNQYYPGKEEETIEIGYFIVFLEKNENGIWQMNQGLFNKIGDNSSSSISDSWNNHINN